MSRVQFGRSPHPAGVQRRVGVFLEANEFGFAHNPPLPLVDRVTASQAATGSGRDPTVSVAGRGAARCLAGGEPEGERGAATGGFLGLALTKIWKDFCPTLRAGRPPRREEDSSKLCALRMQKGDMEDITPSAEIGQQRGPAAGEHAAPPQQAPPHRRLLSLDRTGGVSGARHVLLPIDDTDVRIGTLGIQGTGREHRHKP